MSIFNDVVVKIEENKNPRDWTIDDCREQLTVITRETNDPETIDVSVRLHGLTMLKLEGDKTTLPIRKGSLSKQEMLERAQKADDLLAEALARLIKNLNKARSSRELTYKKKPKNAVAPTIEQGRQNEFGQPFPM
jgi:hypothetical protein